MEVARFNERVITKATPRIADIGPRSEPARGWQPFAHRPSVRSHICGVLTVVDLSIRFLRRTDVDDEFAELPRLAGVLVTRRGYAGSPPLRECFGPPL